MGINRPGNSRLGSFSSHFFFFFLFSANMNLTVFAGILLAVTMATARRASLGEKTMQAAGEADEPVEAMRDAAGPASLVEKIMRAADEADEPDEAKRAKRAICKKECGDNCKGYGYEYEACNNDNECCVGKCTLKGRKRYGKRCFD